MVRFYNLLNKLLKTVGFISHVALLTYEPSQAADHGVLEFLKAPVIRYVQFSSNLFLNVWVGVKC